jgi:hypothetical protein
MFIGRDGRTTDAEHQRQRRRYIYVVYGSPHGQYARFAMLAMFGVSAAEVRALLISTPSVWGKSCKYAVLRCVGKFWFFRNLYVSYSVRAKCKTMQRR